jgi:RNA polymerase sigma factor (sigma-70 family)
MSHSCFNPGRFAYLQAGSRTEFKYYYDQYSRRIHYYLQDRTGDFNDATEVTQQVFIILFRDRYKVVDESHILPFLYTTARNLSLQYLREKGRLEELQVELAYIENNLPGAIDVCSAEELKGEVLAALRLSWLTLPARKRRIVVLFFWHRKSVREIAGQLDIEPQTVRNHLSQSIILLRKNFQGRWEEISLFFS